MTSKQIIMSQTLSDLRNAPEIAVSQSSGFHSRLALSVCSSLMGNLLHSGF